MRELNRTYPLLKDITYGLIGGAIGSIVAAQLGNWLYKFESEEKRRLEEQARPEEPPAAMARRFAEEVLHRPISPKAKARWGNVLHWAYGLTWGMLYGLVRNRIPLFSRAGGLPFGVTFSLIGDEGLNTVLKLTAPPQKFPIEAHLRGFAAHIAYALAADATYRALRRVAE